MSTLLMSVLVIWLGGNAAVIAIIVVAWLAEVRKQARAQRLDAAQGLGGPPNPRLVGYWSLYWRAERHRRHVESGNGGTHGTRPSGTPRSPAVGAQADGAWHEEGGRSPHTAGG